MKNKIKYIFIFLFSFYYNFLYSYEIVRDPIFEEYFSNISKNLVPDDVNVYLVKNNEPNAFVLNDCIYITTGLLEVIEKEDTLKAIYLHEYGHLAYKHLQTKKINNQISNNKNNFFNLFSLGIAVISGSSNIGIGTSLSLNNNLINEISKHSINSEIEADNYMIMHIKKNKINTSELIFFLKQLPDNKNNYFKTHPNNNDRISNLNKISFNPSDNSVMFNWIKSKYSKNSENIIYNEYFKNLEKGIIDQNLKIQNVSEYIVQYEAFKKGLNLKNWDDNFQKLLLINSNTFLKIEYINYLLDNNIKDKYNIIQNLKFDDHIIDEYFYNYIYGKYYNKIGKISLSNFYFCQFYKTIGSKDKADFFCNKFDIKNIPILDKSYALFK